MGIFINGLDVTKAPFLFVADPAGWTLADLYRKLDEPVELGDAGSIPGVSRRQATDEDFKVWSITGGLPVVSERDERKATDDE